MQFSVGLIGCGDVAKRYATAMDDAIEGLRLNAIWDIEPVSGADFANQFGFELVSSFEEFLSPPLNLAVYSPPTIHPMR